MINKETNLLYPPWWKIVNALCALFYRYGISRGRIGKWSNGVFFFSPPYGLKKDVCLPFSDWPKILENKGRLLILSFVFSTNNVIYSKCPKKHFNQISNIMEYNSPFTPWIEPILGLCMKTKTKTKTKQKKKRSTYGNLPTLLIFRLKRAKKNLQYF